MFWHFGGLEIVLGDFTKNWVNSFANLHINHEKPNSQNQKSTSYIMCSRVAQWKRAGPITQRSVDRNHALLIIFLNSTLK